MHYHQTTYPSSPQLIYDMATYYNKTDGFSPTTRKLTGHNSQKTQSPLCSDYHTHQYTHCQHNFRKHHTDGRHSIPKGKMHINCMLLPEDIVCKITQINNIRRENTCDPALKLLNEEITSDIQKNANKTYGRSIWTLTGITGTIRTFFGRPYTVYPIEHLHHIKHFHNIQQQNSNHNQTYCELLHQTIHKHATHKTNRSIN